MSNYSPTSPEAHNCFTEESKRGFEIGKKVGFKEGSLQVIESLESDSAAQHSFGPLPAYTWAMWLRKLYGLEK